MNTIAVSLGDCCIDHYLPPIDREFIGGNALNVAIHMQHAGLPAAFVGAVSSDQYGQITLQALGQQNVDTSHVQRTATPSRRVKIQLTSNNEHAFVHDGQLPTPHLVLDDRTLDFLRQHKLVHTSWLGGAQDSLPAIKQAKLSLSIDYGEGQEAAFLAETRRLADLAFFSMPLGTEEQARSLAAEMHQGGTEVVVVTRGQAGSLAFCNGELYSQPAPPVRVVDSLGAGDAFIGTFLAGWLAGLSVSNCLEQATQAAGIACTHYGGWAGSEVI